MKTTQLKTSLAMAIGLALSGNAYAEIIISQYVEGASYNKSVTQVITPFPFLVMSLNLNTTDWMNGRTISTYPQ